MSPILALDAASGGLEAGVYDAALRPLAERAEPEARGAAHRLLPLAEACLAEAGLAWRDLALIAVCTGPGDFTGARAAVAAARGLALATGARAAGASRFDRWREAFLPNAGGHAFDGPVTVALAARGPLVHVARFEAGRLAQPAPATLPAAEAGAWAARALLLGDAARRALHEATGEGRPLETPRPPLAALARAAARNAAEGAPRPAPLYLRPPDAAPAPPPPRIVG